MRKHLVDTYIKSLKSKEKPYKLADGGGLFLLVTPGGSKLWRLAYRYGGKQKLLALGQYPHVGLSEARRMREEAKEALARGIDPSLKKKAEKQSRADTFGAIAREWFERMKATWSQGHTEKTKGRLDGWLLPWLDDVPIRQVTAPLILECARRAEQTGRLETAHRVIQLAGQVIRYAISTARAETDPTPALRGALSPAPERHYAAPTTPEALCQGEPKIPHLWELKIPHPPVFRLPVLPHG